MFTADPSGALCMWRLTLGDNQLTQTLQAHFPNSIGDPTKLQSTLAVRYQSSFNARIVCLDSFPEKEVKFHCILYNIRKNNASLFVYEVLWKFDL